MSFRFSERIENLAQLRLSSSLGYPELFCKHSEKEEVSTGTSIDSPRSNKSCWVGQMALVDRVTGWVDRGSKVYVACLDFSEDLASRLWSSLG